MQSPCEGGVIPLNSLFPVGWVACGRSASMRNFKLAIMTSTGGLGKGMISSPIAKWGATGKAWGLPMFIVERLAI